MIPFTIIIGVLALLAAKAAGITDNKLGTAAVTAVVLLFIIAALPQCYWLFDEPAGLLLAALIWIGSTAFYHRILADSRRPATGAGRRFIIWQLGRQRLAIAYAWSAI